MPQSQLQVNSAMAFSPICVQSLPWRRLWGISNFKQEANGSSKMADGSANEVIKATILKNPFSQSELVFNCKWPFPYGGCHFLGTTDFRVGRWIEFLHDDSEALHWMKPSCMTDQCYRYVCIAVGQQNTLVCCLGSLSWLSVSEHSCSNLTSYGHSQEASGWWVMLLVDSLFNANPFFQNCYGSFM